jgi:nitrate reductase gamma subunit
VKQVEGWIEFGRGPLFRLSFSLMILGLLRILILIAIGIGEAYRRSSDRIVPWKEIGRQTLGWLVPIGRLGRQRPAYSLASFLFHTGLILTPLFLAAHVLLWRDSVGIAWRPLPQRVADYLTLLTIAAGLGLFFGRALNRGARALSRFQDYLWPLLLVTPFVTGYICSNAAIGPKAYQRAMLLHVWSADLIMVMIPFTKIAHCVLAPLSQLVTAVSWKFVPGAGDRVAATLGFGETGSWMANARSGAAGAAPAEERKEIYAK